jgi:hypothetical protein
MSVEQLVECLAGETEVLVEKMATVPLCSPQIPCKLTRDRTMAAAVDLPRMMTNYDEGGAVGAMTGRGNGSTRRKPAPVLLCSPQIPCELTRDRTLAAAVDPPRMMINDDECGEVGGMLGR